MPTYLHPGVYVEEIPSGSKPIEGVETSVAAFVGYTTRGPIGEAVRIGSWDEYKERFGGINSPTDEMGLAVNAFYLNGGKKAYIARLAANAKKAKLALQANSTDVLLAEAVSAGAWGNEIEVSVTKASDPFYGNRFTLHVIRKDANGDKLAEEEFANLVMDPRGQNYALKVVNESSQLIRLMLDPGITYQKGTWLGTNLDMSVFNGDDLELTLNIDSMGVKTIVLEGINSASSIAIVVSQIVAKVTGLGPAYAGFTCIETSGSLQMESPAGPSSSIKILPGGAAGPLKLVPPSATPNHGASDVVPDVVSWGDPAGALAGGDDGNAPGGTDYADFFSGLKKVRDVNIIVLPGSEIQSDGTKDPGIDEALAHCAATRSRMVILDLAADITLANPNDVTNLNLNPSTYGVLYYPWVKVANPFAAKDATQPPTLSIAPSAFAAGKWSQTDGRRGVWKAPAGVETALLGLVGLKEAVDDDEQDFLNPQGVNAFRRQPGFGHVIWGSRTLATNADPEWRYVPVRRTAIFIEQSIYNGIQWAVFEPNNHILWSSLRVNIESFMDGLFRSGAFQGEKASDAFFVRCGLGDTMTQADIDRGQVIVIVGFAPLKPAEFVIVRIQQKVGQE